MPTPNHSETNPFRAALAMFGDDGQFWGQGVKKRTDGRRTYRCARGALGDACRTHLLTVRAERMLARALGDGITTATDDGATWRVSSVIEAWNDQGGRTFEDVALMFKRCAETWDEEER